MTEYPSERSEMSAITEASGLVQTLAEPRPVSDSVKAAIGRAARRLGWAYSRTKDIWYRDARITIKADEIDQLRAAAARHELDIAVAHVVALRQSLAATDPALHRQVIASLDSALLSLGAPLGSLDIQSD